MLPFVWTDAETSIVIYAMECDISGSSLFVTHEEASVTRA